MDQSITRRKVLTAAGAIGAAAALTRVGGVQAASDEDGDAVTGTWVVTVTSAANPQQPPFTSIVAFAAGGSLITADTQHGGTPSLGAWERSGSHSFKAVFDAFNFDQSGTFVGTAIVHPKGTVDGDQIRGTFSVDFHGAGGFSQNNVDHGSFAGSRLEP